MNWPVLLQPADEPVEPGNVPVLGCDKFEAESALSFHCVILLSLVGGPVPLICIVLVMFVC